MSVAREIKFGNSRILYAVKRSNRKKTSQIIVDRNGVQILVPKGKSNNEIRSLVKSNSKWIYQKQLEKTQNFFKVSYTKDSELLYLGKKYPIKIIKGKEDKFVLSRGKFIITSSKFLSPKITELYEKWLREKSEPIIKKHVNLIATKTGIPTSKINIKNHKERWGSLSSDGSINLNVNLIRASTKILDYVIIHELCHKRIPDHSPRYWNLVHKIMPDYNQHKEWLRNNWNLINS